MRQGKMTKTHFQRIAGAMREMKPLFEGHIKFHAAVETMANTLRETNPMFDWDKFVEACEKE